MRKPYTYVVLALLFASAIPLSPDARVVGASARTADGNNAPEDAVELANGSWICDDLDLEDDELDYYSVPDVLAGQTILVTVISYNSSNWLNISLFNLKGVSLFTVIGIQGMRAEPGLAPQNGTYYIMIQAGSYGLSPYNVSVQVGWPRVLTPGVTEYAALNSTNLTRSAWYKFWLSGNQGGLTDAIWINPAIFSSGATFGMAIYDLLNWNSTHVYSLSSSSATKTNLSAAATYTGWYYYNIYCSYGASSFRLDSAKFQMAADGDNDYLYATPVSKNHDVSGRVDKAWDYYDWLSYRVPAGDFIVVSVCATGSSDSGSFGMDIYSSAMVYIGGAIGYYYYYSSVWYVYWANATTTSTFSDDTFYVCVYPIYFSDGASADINGTLDYRVEIRTTNHPPQLVVPFDEINITEDERFRVNAYEHFRDEDDDPLVLSVVASHIRGSYCATTGDLDIYGEWNWIGSERARIKATDPRGMETIAFVNVTVTWVNHAPYLKKPIPDVCVNQNSKCGMLDLSQYIVDNDTVYGDKVSYGALGNRSLWVDIANSGHVNLTAPVDFWGTVDLTFTALDKYGLMAEAPCRVVVAHVYQPPQVRGGIPAIDVEENGELTVDFSPYIWDPNGFPITLTPSENVRIEVITYPEDLNVTFRPQRDIGGFSEVIRLAAKDSSGLGGNSAEVTVNVLFVNQAPRLSGFSPPGDITLIETDSLDFSLVATDVERGQVLNYTWYLDDRQVSEGMSAFKYRTDYSSAGTHRLKAVVDDGERTSEHIWKVTIRDLDREPAKVAILSPKAGAVLKEGVSVQLEGDATDPDGDALVFFWFDGSTGIGTGRNLSVFLEAGVHKLSLEASDGSKSARSPTVSITVKANNRPSILSVEPGKGKKFTTGTSIPMTADVIDADGDQLTYCWTENGRVIGTNQSFALTGLSVGKHRVQLVVSDGMAVTQSTAEFEVVEPGAAAADNMMYMIGGLIAVLAVVVAVAVVARGRKRPPEKPVDFKQPEQKW